MNDKIYCVYLTIYKGNKLPPFYIGSTTLENIDKGYHGTVCSKKYKTIWLDELKNSPSLFKTIVLSKYETFSKAVKKEQYFQNSFRVISNPMFINLAIGRNLSEIPWNKGKSGLQKHSEETLKKLRKPKPLRTEIHKKRNGLSSGRTRKGMKIGRYEKDRIDIGRPQPQIKCPYCDKIGGYASMNRWHFKNCKKRNCG